MKTPAWNIRRVNPQKIAPIFLCPINRTGKNPLFEFQLDADRIILFFDKNANPPDTIPGSLYRYKRENIIIVQIDVPSGQTIDQIVRVFTCKEPSP